MRPSLTRYARAVERHWADRLEQPSVLSPREWALIENWQQRGIPLALVIEAIDAVLERPSHRRGPPRSLGAIADSLEKAWQVVLDGRLATSEPREPSEDERVGARRQATLGAWRARIEMDDGTPLADYLESLLSRCQAGESPQRIDDALDGRLIDLSPESVRMEGDSLATAELDDLRERMDDGRYETARRRALIAFLRRRLNLPRLGC